jgi:RHS repeat-associated protein
MMIKERSWSSSSYRFGFNGIEQDDEVKGNGNTLDFAARIYDSRLGRFLSIDPAYMDYPMWSPYLFAANSPIRYIDVDGYGPGDVVVMFAGAWIGEPIGKDGISDTNLPHMVDNITGSQAAPGAAVKAFPSKFWGTMLNDLTDLDVATEAAYQYVKAHYKKDADGKDTETGQVVLYGFSWGGNMAQHLADRLKADGIEVDLLVTVDQADGPLLGDDAYRVVSDNVKKNVNIYQTTPEKGTTSHGGKNYAEDSDKTEVNNYNVTGNERNGETVEHSNIHLIYQDVIEVEVINTIDSDDQ